MPNHFSQRYCCSNHRHRAKDKRAPERCKLRGQKASKKRTKAYAVYRFMRDTSSEVLSTIESKMKEPRPVGCSELRKRASRVFQILEKVVPGSLARLVDQAYVHHDEKRAARGRAIQRKTHTSRS